MSSFVLYCKDDCIWCERAKNLLSTRGYTYEVKTLGRDYTKEELVERLEVPPYSKVTVPQIWYGFSYIGGFEQLAAVFENEQGTFEISSLERSSIHG